MGKSVTKVPIEECSDRDAVLAIGRALVTLSHNLNQSMRAMATGEKGPFEATTPTQIYVHYEDGEPCDLSYDKEIVS